jgi:D-lactate dehydrogenase
MLHVAVYETRTYDRQHLEAASDDKPIRWRFDEFRLTEETALTTAGMGAVCVFVNDLLDKKCLTILKQQQVRMIALRCMGFNNVDIAAAKSLGIAVTRVPAYSPYAVAEHTIGLLLTLNRRVHRSFNRVRELNFSLNGLVGFDLHGKTAGLLGTGKIGKIVAEILRGFGMRVLAYDPYPAHEWANSHQVQYVPVADLMRQSDVISLHLPLTPETHHLVNAEALESLKPGAYLINVSRGKLIDTSALVEALKSGQLGGVALDVYEEEEGIFFQDLSGEMLQDDVLARLLTFPNVLITAHQAFLTHEALTDIAHVTVENLCRLERGAPFIEGTSL